MRLVSGGTLSVSDLGAALNMQRQQPQMRLGDVLVRMGLSTRDEIEAVAWEQMCDQTLTLLDWHEPATNFIPMPQASVPPGGPSVEELLDAARTRAASLQQIIRRIGGADTVPALADSADGNPDTALRPMDWAVMCRIDGQRSLRQISDQAGLTTLEAASILQGLMAAGLAQVPETHLPPVDSRPPVWPQHQQVAAPAPAKTDLFDDPAELLRELSELGSDPMSGRHGGR